MIHKCLLYVLYIGFCFNLNASEKPTSLNTPAAAIDSAAISPALDSIFQVIQKLITSNPEECIPICEKALQLAQNTNNDSIKAEIMLVYAKANYVTGHSQKGLELLLEVEEISAILQDDILKAKSLLNQGNVYWFNKSYKEALKYYNEAYQIGIDKDNNEIKGWALNNIGLIYEFINSHDSALLYMQKAQEIRIQEKDTAHIYTGYYNIGAVYQSMENYKVSTRYMLKAIEQDGRYIPAAEYGHYLIYIGNGYFKTDDLKNAELYLLKGISKCKEINSIYSLEEGYRYLSEVYEAQNKLADALKFQKRSSALKDSLYNKQMAEQITKLKLDHEADKKEKEIKLLRLEKELNEKEAKRQDFQGKIYLAISILLGIILVLVYRQIHIHKGFNSKLQDQVDLKTTELKTATDKAIRANNLKTEFLKNMSHEVRTPLNAIQGFSSLLADSIPDDTETYSQLGIISLNTELLLDIFNDILELSQLENGEISIEKSNFNFRDFIKSLATNYSQKIEGLGLNEVKLEYETKVSADLEINTDKRHLEEALSNLIDNAIKFTEKGYIKIGAVENNKCLRILIEDSGIGIDLKHHNEIFEKFTKLESNNNKLYGGAGLGLTICKLLVEKLDGEIWCESEINKGATFIIELPLNDKEFSA